MTDFIVESFTPMAKSTLVGFATVRAPSGLVFHDVGVHRKDDALWASPASKAMISKEGIVLKDSDGKTRWSPVISFATKQARGRWSAEVIEAIKQQRPEVLG